MLIHGHMFRVSDPITQALFLALIGLVWLIFRRHRVGMAFIALGVLWTILCATPAFASLLSRGLDQQYVSQPADMYPVVDAIVVLGGGRLPLLRDTDNPEQLATTRLGFAILLYRDKRAPVVLLSGGEGSAISMSHRMQKFGVPDSALLTDTRSLNTYQNAEFSTAILKAKGAQRILLVTSPDHMQRSLASFGKQGLDVVPAISADKQAKRNPEFSWWPHPAVLRLSERILHEYIGYYAYKARGWA